MKGQPNGHGTAPTLVRDKGSELVGMDPADIVRLAEVLETGVAGEVRFDPISRALYASDASNYRQVPIGVVIPRNVADVEKTIAAARASGAPVLSRGGGTGIPGQSVNNALMIDFAKYMHRILHVDPARRTARVEPGVVLDELRDAAKQHGLTFGPDPATHSRCTLGGMIGNNSCGSHSIQSEFYGPGPRTSDNIVDLEVLTYDGVRLRVGATADDEIERIVSHGGRRGEIYAGLRALRDRYADEIRARFPQIPRRVSGYNLDALLPERGFHVAQALVGSESTCVTVLDATVMLIPNPAFRSLAILGYEDIGAAGDQVPLVRESRPVALEGMDDGFIEALRLKGHTSSELEGLPPGGAWLLVEFAGETQEEADAATAKLAERMKTVRHAPTIASVNDPARQQLIWNLREEGLGATAHVPGHKDNHEGWEDAAVPPERLGAYLREFRSLLKRFDYQGVLYGHFGQGCVHTRLDFDLKTKAGITNFRSFLHEAAELVTRYGGSLSGEHGDGQARGELLPIMFGDNLMNAFREFKSIWDPDWKMNPGKLIRPDRVDEHLRLGTSYDPVEPVTHLHYPDDKNSFARAAERCVGAGVCRRKQGGVMCPSYMVTLEEKHSTRGRARLLSEMMRGSVVTGGWRDDGVREALDLCLACKGCKGECPVHVDMATYKAEFLSHYYHRRLRPMAAYSMGLIHRWAPLAGIAPRAVNAILQSRFGGALARRLGGIAEQRQMPRFANQSFVAWFRERRDRPQAGGQRVILWPDTFTNYFHPEIAQAAVEVLEHAGFQVDIPTKRLCCGRPLYDWGFLTTARALLQEILDTLRHDIENGVPIVGLEPSCVSVFRDELRNTFPASENANRLRQQTFLLGEFLRRFAPDYQPQRLRASAIVHPHCHHRSILTLDSDKAMLDRVGLDYTLLDAGCCGMAGSFGFDRRHFEISMQIGERALLPAVRSAPGDTLLVADGFSCREQIRQATGREPIHLAQLLQGATRSTR